MRWGPCPSLGADETPLVGSIARQHPYLYSMPVTFKCRVGAWLFRYPTMQAREKDSIMPRLCILRIKKLCYVSLCEKYLEYIPCYRYVRHLMVQNTVPQLKEKMIAMSFPSVTSCCPTFRKQGNAASAIGHVSNHRRDEMVP